jgi:hypothetical protein
MNGEVFHKWCGKMLSKLDPGSVTVMENVPFHSANICQPTML